MHWQSTHTKSALLTAKQDIVKTPLPRRYGLCPSQCAAAELLCHSRRARPYPAHFTMYKSRIHINMYQGSYTELKRATHFPELQCLGRGGPTPSFPLPNAPPKHRRCPMCLFPKREHSFIVQSAVLPARHGTRAHADNPVWEGRGQCLRGLKKHMKKGSDL